MPVTSVSTVASASVSSLVVPFPLLTNNAHYVCLLIMSVFVLQQLLSYLMYFLRAQAVFEGFPYRGPTDLTDYSSLPSAQFYTLLQVGVVFHIHWVSTALKHWPLVK